MKTRMTSLALMAIITSSAFAALKAPLPEFKNEKQLAEWRAEKASQPNTRRASTESAFYTGRPYLTSSGSYAFKYRAYNPEIARWTSEDPSGFPDGANGNVYAPNPNSEFDYAGLLVLSRNFAGGDNFSKSPFKKLNPNVDGTITYEMNDAKTHFTKSATGNFGNQTSDWDDTIVSSGESAIYTTGVISQANSGTVVIAGEIAWKKDWIEVNVTLRLAVKNESGGHLTTTYFAPQIYTTKTYGEPYE